MGETIEAQYKDGPRWYRGKIVSANANGTYDVRYDDGDDERAMAAHKIRKTAGLSGAPYAQTRSLGSSALGGGGVGGLAEGDKVEADYRGRGKFYSGRIARSRGDGTYDIDYDDGEKEVRVDGKLIRPKVGGGLARSPPARGAAAVTRSLGRLAEGDKVEADYRGRGKFYKGNIARDRGDGTYDVDYDDGEKESRVQERLIRRLAGPSSPAAAARGGRGASAALREGDKVEARYRGREKYYKGTIDRDRGDGTYDITYDDGERESRVDEKLIRPLGGGAVLIEGDRVEADYRGRGKFYKGKIQRDRGDGTYDVFYDDGEKELRVDGKMIRPLDGAVAAVGGRGGGGSVMEGDKVEADYRGRGKFYKGKVSRDRGDGTYDIEYDDGERESRVDIKLIRPLGGGAGVLMLMEGDKVEADYRGRGKFYKGKIARDRGDGTYDVHYDDGEKELRVDQNMIRPLDGGGAAVGGRGGGLVEGDKVEARYRGREKYYKGKIARDRGDGTYDIHYDDGEKELRVDEKLIRPLSGGVGAVGGRGAALMEGDKVEADYRGRGKHYKGKIARDRGDGTYDVHYDDGEKELRVDEKLIRPLDGLGGGGRGGGGLMEGDKVEANYRARGKFYKGRIARDRGDGTYDVEYDDGEKESRIDEKLIRPLDGGGIGGRGGAAVLMEGDKVEADYRGRGKFYKGKIARNRGDGTYDVNYDDGEKELRVDEKKIRPLGGAAVGGRGAALMEGDKVEADYRGRGKFYKGKIARDRGDGTYDVFYDDGEKELRVDEQMIRPLGGAAAVGGRGAVLMEGDKVEADYRGRGKFYKGKIQRDRGDGTYDIYYDDGEKELRVDEKLIRPLDGLGGGGVRGGSLREGDKVEADYRGRGKFYKGKISRDRGDGTFDVDYDDGERESRVAERLIRPLDGGGGRGGGAAVLMEDDKVEADYRGRGKYYKGKIARDRGDGTYDIHYDDGEKELRVDEKLIRPLSGGGGAVGGRGAALMEGDKVEANYRGRGKFYKGKIQRDRGDGTYDVFYDDGEKELRVDEKLIRPLDGLGGGGRGGGGLMEGDKVEADFRGRGKFYKGKISRDRGDGTYDIHYDDGEREARVDEMLIRPLDGGGCGGRGRGGGLMEGDKVEADYRGRGKFYKGKISRDRGDGTYDIAYADGEREARVDEKLIRPLDGGGGGRSGGAVLREGDKVEANYRGRGKFYKGNVQRDRGDGTYDIFYDDGEKELRVDEKLIRPLEGLGGGGRGGGGSLMEGDKVEADYRGRGKFYKGKIQRDRGDGTYDIFYDDGEKELRVDEKLIRSLDGLGSSGGSSSAVFEVGDRVEADYKGRGKFYKGKIGRVHLGGEYDVEYDDGEREARVVGSLIRPLSARGVGDRSRISPRRDVRSRMISPRRTPLRSRSPSPRRSRSAGLSSDPFLFREGDAIEARFRGKDAYFPGVIRTDRADGTYDVAYDDGAVETRVREDLIRASGGGRRGSAAGFEVGDRVEADYKGRGKFYKGKIGRVHLGGEYDIEYDDGEREVRVRESDLRSLGGGGGNNRGRRDRSPVASRRRGGGDDDEARRLKDRLRDLEDRLADERGGRTTRLNSPAHLGGGGSEVEALLRENREMRNALESSASFSRGGTGFGGGALTKSFDGGKMLASTSAASGRHNWNAIVSADDDIVDEMCAAIGAGHGSVGQWLNSSATPLEKRNFIEFVQTLEDYEARRGLTPANRPADDGSGTINLALGPTIRVQLKFLV